MPREPVAKINYLIAQPETAPTQDIRTDEAYPKPTMRLRKRTGFTEPVDVTKIVHAVDRCCAGLADIDPLRIATTTISGLYKETSSCPYSPRA